MIEPKDHLEEQYIELCNKSIALKRYIESFKGKRDLTVDELAVFKAQLDCYLADIVLLRMKMDAEYNKLVEDLWHK